MTSLQILEQQLKVYELALKKSKEAYKNGTIGELLHEAHVVNLTPKIQEYQYAIGLLKLYPYYKSNEIT